VTSPRHGATCGFCRLPRRREDIRWARKHKMDTTLTLTNLAGSVALLLWGVHMVQTGIQRAFGSDLRSFLGRALDSRLRAFLAGLGVTTVLQSSTATALMVASFTRNGFVDLLPALAVMLGANVGTTFIVQIFSFDVARIAPVLVLVGLILFRRSGQTRTRDLGRVSIGLGLMVMALHQLLEITSPFEDLPSLRVLLGTITTDPIIASVFGGLIAVIAHSSVAAVLLVTSLAAKGIVPPQAAFALILGANLGTAINPVLEGAKGADPASRRLPVGNLLNRVTGWLIGLATLNFVGPLFVLVEPDAARSAADFHTAFNVILALLFFPLLGPLARGLTLLLPTRVDLADPGRAVYLDSAAKEMPAIALAGAAREALRMADIFETMLNGTLEALEGGDRRRIAETKRMDDLLDRLNRAITAYLTTLDPETLNEQDHQRLSEILAFATNIEYAGDIIEKNVMSQASKRLKRKLSFSKTGIGDIQKMIDRLQVNLRAAGAAFMTDDARATYQLAGEKDIFRNLEARATEDHFARLRAGEVDSVESSALHLDVLRDLRRVNGHLVAASAYPIMAVPQDAQN
jgi:phosphate:Na+ symporter